MPESHSIISAAIIATGTVIAALLLHLRVVRDLKDDNRHLQSEKQHLRHENQELRDKIRRLLRQQHELQAQFGSSIARTEHAPRQLSETPKARPTPLTSLPEYDMFYSWPVIGTFSAAIVIVVVSLPLLFPLLKTGTIWLAAIIGLIVIGWLVWSRLQHSGYVWLSGLEELKQYLGDKQLASTNDNLSLRPIHRILFGDTCSEHFSMFFQTNNEFVLTKDSQKSTKGTWAFSEERKRIIIHVGERTLELRYAILSVTGRLGWLTLADKDGSYQFQFNVGEFAFPKS